MGGASPTNKVTPLPYRDLRSREGVGVAFCQWRRCPPPFVLLFKWCDQVLTLSLN